MASEEGVGREERFEDVHAHAVNENQGQVVGVAYFGGYLAGVVGERQAVHAGYVGDGPGEVNEVARLGAGAHQVAFGEGFYEVGYSCHVWVAL